VFVPVRLSWNETNVESPCKVPALQGTHILSPSYIHTYTHTLMCTNWRRGTFLAHCHLGAVNALVRVGGHGIAEGCSSVDLVCKSAHSFSCSTQACRPLMSWPFVDLSFLCRTTSSQGMVFRSRPHLVKSKAWQAVQYSKFPLMLNLVPTSCEFALYPALCTRWSYAWSSSSQACLKCSNQG